MSSGDAKFFTSHKKGEKKILSRSVFGHKLNSCTLAGEIAEWRDEISNPDKDKKKDAVKKGAGKSPGGQIALFAILAPSPNERGLTLDIN